MYIIVNPETLDIQGGIHRTLNQATEAYRKALDTYGITTHYKIYRLTDKPIRQAK